MSLMLRSIFLTMLLLLSGLKALAQDDQIDDLTFEEVEIEEESRPYFAVAGGFIGEFFFVNLDDVNELLPGLGFPNSEELSTPILMTGAQGFTGFPFISWAPNLRVGFFSIGGNSQKEIEFDSVTTQGLEYDVNMMGFSLDYAWVPMKSLAILGGASAWWGSININAYKSPKTSSWDDVGNGIGNYFYQNAEKTVAFIQPNLYIEYAVTGYAMIRFNAGYTFDISSKDSWTYNKSSELTGVPDKIKTDGLKLGFGIFLGLFNY